MSELIAFGDPSRYYAARTPGQTGRAKLTLTEMALRDRLGAESRKRIERVYKDSGQTIRGCLRSETGLRLAKEGQQEVVSVHVVDSIPYPVLKLLEEVKDPAIWDFILKRRLLSETKAGLEFAHEHFDQVLHVLGQESSSTTREHVESTHRLISRLLDALPAMQIVVQILQHDHDLLGAYFFHQSRIEMYWIVLGLVSAFSGIDLGDLTVVVLAHELAHAYTHLGFDIDNIQWDTANFSGADDRIVEGLAQFYTRAVCARLSSRHPGYLLAYQSFVRQQQGPYRAHEEWASEEESAGETVRAAMVAVRGHGVQTYDGFLELLKGPIRPKKKNESPTEREETQPGLF
jgi:hypothetical protein